MAAELGPRGALGLGLGHLVTVSRLDIGSSDADGLIDVEGVAGRLWDSQAD